MDDTEQIEELIKLLDEPEAEFEIRCKACGSTDVSIDDGRRMGSSWTGMYGSCELRCNACKASKTIIDT